ncbi:hypothetical protein [Kribbella sancticallisti]|uniref:hypothetical protein n=1 Tax=Kribbella sancticallisti TaxID=460087 RepID=UPI0031DEE815
MDQKDLIVVVTEVAASLRLPLDLDEALDRQTAMMSPAASSPTPSARLADRPQA